MGKVEGGRGRRGTDGREADEGWGGGGSWRDRRRLGFRGMDEQKHKHGKRMCVCVCVCVREREREE